MIKYIIGTLAGILFFIVGTSFAKQSGVMGEAYNRKKTLLDIEIKRAKEEGNFQKVEDLQKQKDSLSADHSLGCLLFVVAAAAILLFLFYIFSKWT